VVERQAALIAQWMNVGFIHGVMNTDNMTISGETIDYGPCAFVEAYDPAAVFSSIDLRGRYAFGNQPDMALWNLARFAETLLPLLSEKPDEAIAMATEVLSAFLLQYLRPGTRRPCWRYSRTRTRRRRGSRVGARAVRTKIWQRRSRRVPDSNAHARCVPSVHG
jgi:hypothetical protein